MFVCDLLVSSVRETHVRAAATGRRQRWRCRRQRCCRRTHSRHRRSQSCCCCELPLCPALRLRACAVRPTTGTRIALPPPAPRNAHASPHYISSRPGRPRSPWSVASASRSCRPTRAHTCCRRPRRRSWASGWSRSARPGACATEQPAADPRDDAAFEPRSHATTRLSSHADVQPRSHAATQPRRRSASQPRRCADVRPSSHAQRCARAVPHALTRSCNARGHPCACCANRPLSPLALCRA